jgi:hypothetical protein
MKKTLAKNKDSDSQKKLELQQIIKNLTTIRLNAKKEIVGKKQDINKLKQEIFFLKGLKSRKND